MASVNEISAQVRAFLGDRISLQELEDWSASYSWNIHQRADQETQNLAYAVRGLLVDYSSGDIDEATLRRELATAALPFVLSAVRISLKSSDTVFVLSAPGIVPLRLSGLDIEAMRGRPMARAATAAGFRLIGKSQNDTESASFRFQLSAQRA